MHLPLKDRIGAMGINFLKYGWCKVVGLGILLGLCHSCSLEMAFPDKVENPFATFYISGKVIDSQSKEPVKGAVVTRYETYINYQTQQVEMIESISSSYTVREDGTFSFSGEIYNNNYRYMYIGANSQKSSSDSTQMYESKLVLVEMEAVQTSKPGSENGYQGHYTGNVTIELNAI